MHIGAQRNKEVEIEKKDSNKLYLEDRMRRSSIYWIKIRGENSTVKEGNMWKDNN